MNTTLYDLEWLGRKIEEYTKELKNFRALIDGRQFLANGLHAKYPNMKIDAIRHTLWQQEQEQKKKTQLVFDEMRMFAESCGWHMEYKEVTNEVTNILQKEIITFDNLNI